MASQSLSGCTNCLTTGNLVEEEDEVGEEVAGEEVLEEEVAGEEIAGQVIVEEGNAVEDRLELSLMFHHQQWLMETPINNEDNAEHAVSMHLRAFLVVGKYIHTYREP